MKIYCDSREPIDSKGSFRLTANAINKIFKKIGYLGTKEDCDIYLFATSCDSHVRHPRSKTALLLAWETSSPQSHVAQNIRGATPFAISKQVADTYEKAGVKMDYIHLGINPDSWKAASQKFDKISFFSHNTSNSRSGLESTITAFGRSFKENKSVRLIVKDRPDGRLHGFINNISIAFGVDIVYDTRDLGHAELQELYAKSHYSIYGTNAAGFALTVPESMACGTPVIATSCPCIKEYMTEDFGLFIDHEFKPFNKEYVDKCAQFGISNSMDLQGYTEEPFMWYPVYEDLVKKFKMAYEEILDGTAAKKGAAAEKFVKENLTWDLTAKRLVEKLEKYL
jgi:glycosyltransferase involved in cell wall biosynthesis